MRRVEPREAKKGEFLKSFDIEQYKEMLRYGGETEDIMKNRRIRGEIIFTRIPGKYKKFDTWQVFLLKK